jgi:senataxin
MISNQIYKSFPLNYLSFVDVNTVDSFQGSEQDMVIISTVRTIDSDSQTLGFLHDYRRLNVAVSRAKYACFIVGNQNALVYDTYWENLIDYLKNLDCVISLKNTKYIEEKEINKFISNREEKEKERRKKFIQKQKKAKIKRLNNLEEESNLNWGEEYIDSKSKNVEENEEESKMEIDYI